MLWEKIAQGWAVQCEGETVGGGWRVATSSRGQGGSLNSKVCLSSPNKVRELGMQVFGRKQAQEEQTDTTKT